MTGYNIGRIHVVTVRVKCSGAHIDTNAYILQDENTICTEAIVCDVYISNGYKIQTYNVQLSYD